MTEERPRDGEAATEFGSFLGEEWRAWLEQAPEVATWVGVPGLNDRWSDDTPDGVTARQRLLAAGLRRIGDFDRTRLPAPDQRNYDLYLELLASAQEGIRFGDDAFPFRFGVPRNLWTPLNQLEGIHHTAADVLDLQPHTSVQDYEDVLSRLHRLPAAVAQTLALLEAGLRRNITPPRIAVRAAPEQVRRLVPEDPAASALLGPFREMPHSVPAAERARLTEEAHRAYRDEVLPSFARLAQYLDETYLPACRESVGISELPDGSAIYAARVRWQTTTGLSPHEVHEVGLAEVRRIRREMDRVIERTGFRGSFAEFRTFLRTDPRFFFRREEELVDRYRVLAKKCDPTLPRLFGRLPRLPYGVLPIPSFRAANSPAAYYAPGAPATGRPGYFYVNTCELGSRAAWEMEAFLLHESVPGHHLQIALAQELDQLPDFRRFSGVTAFVEGWGLYAESLGEELGFYTDPYSKFGELSFDMWRSVRLVVDTGIHAMGWSRDRAIAFFQEHTGTSEQDIAVEVDRYIVWPGQALAYKIGQLKLKELRRFAEARLGDRFDVRGFHDVVLSEGAIPLGELERRVQEWVERRVAAAPGSSRSRGAP